MPRLTVDYGIDLGTTNSSIAIAERGEVKVINNGNSPVTPSAVLIDDRGDITVGTDALDAFQSELGDSVCVEFKRKMGTDWAFVPGRSKERYTPVFLAAKILEEVRRNAEMVEDEQVGAAVITIPASYGEAERAAVNGAAALAGLGTTLIPEPVAAAAAYGIGEKSGNAHWLVYDLGGGTFDVALLKVANGTSRVVAHGGLKQVGGKNIDWEIVDNKLMPLVGQTLGIERFLRSEPEIVRQYSLAIQQLKAAAEKVKIKLSRDRQSTVPVLLRAPNSSDRRIPLRVELSRAEMESLAAPYVTQTIQCVKELLAGQKLGIDDIERVFLVGGPTLMPYVKRRLESDLCNRLKFNIDPFTVVAQGAAIVASHIRIEELIREKRPAGAYGLSLGYSPIGNKPTFAVSGALESPTPNEKEFEKFAIVFNRQSPSPSQTRVQLNTNAKFSSYLKVEPGNNVFEVQLFGGAEQVGLRQADQRIEHNRNDEGGIIDPSVPISHSIGVILSDNSYDRILVRGRDRYPAVVERKYQSSHVVKAQGDGGLLRIPIIEGERSRGDRNLHIGDLDIPATKIRRDLPQGTKVEVTIHLEPSGIAWAEAYIPLLDEFFREDLKLTLRSPDLETLGETYREAMGRRDSLKQAIEELSAADLAETERARQIFREFEGPEGYDQQISDLRLRANTQEEALYQLEPKVIDFQARVDEAEEIRDWLQLVNQAHNELNWAQREAGAHGGPEQKKRAAGIQEALENAIRAKNDREVQAAAVEANELANTIYFMRYENWVVHFLNLKARYHASCSQFDNASTNEIERILKNCSPQGNPEAFKTSVVQLQNALQQSPQGNPAGRSGSSPSGIDRLAEGA